MWRKERIRLISSAGETLEFLLNIGLIIIRIGMRFSQKSTLRPISLSRLFLLKNCLDFYAHHHRRLGNSKLVVKWWKGGMFAFSFHRERRCPSLEKFLECAFSTLLYDCVTENHWQYTSRPRFSSPQKQEWYKDKRMLSFFLHILFLEIGTARLQQTHHLMVHFVVDSLCWTRSWRREKMVEPKVLWTNQQTEKLKQGN